MSSSHPKLTIVMPAHNASKFLNITLESFVKQSFSDWNLIVIDDASTDTTWDIIMSWQQMERRIHGLQNETNLRVALTMNKGIELVQSPYFARVDSDDVLLPDHFEKIIHFLDTHSDIDLSGSQVITIDGNGQFRRKWNYETDPIWIKSSAIFACPFLQSSVVMRTSVIKSVGGYRPDMELIEDYDLWIRILQKYKAANIEDYTIQYRIHENNMSETNKSTLLKMLEGLYVSNSEFYPIEESQLGLHARMEVGEWSDLSKSEWDNLKQWRRSLIAINKKEKMISSRIYADVIKKYFTNAYMKIATQNGGVLRFRSLALAFFISPFYFMSIIKRKKENLIP